MNVSIQEILTQAFGFIILMFVLKRLFWKPLLSALDLRRDKIKSDFDQIDSAKKDIEKLRAEYSAHLQKIDEESRQRIQEAVEEGRRIAREIQDKARVESQATFDKAKENLNLEVAKARLTLRREIADLTIGVSEKVLREKLNDAKQQEKIQELIKELETAS